jgi:hypothetical protein
MQLHIDQIINYNAWTQYKPTNFTTTNFFYQLATILARRTAAPSIASFI